MKTARKPDPRGDGREPVDHAGGGERAQRVEALARKVNAADEEHEQRRPGHADGEPDAHLERELLDDDPERPVVCGRELEHPDHQRDPDRVVDAGLALEDRPGAAADLLVAEDREHHRRVGGRERGAEDPRRRPAEVQQVVRAARR